MSLAQTRVDNNTSASESGQEPPAMSPQQKRFRRGGLATYKEFVVGDKGWGSFSAFECYNLLFSNLPGIVGYGMRSLLLPFFFEEHGKGALVGRSVTIRQPSRILLGKGAIIEDFVTLDVRSSENGTVTPRLEIGDYVFIGRHTAVGAKGSKVTLGRACNISAHCRLVSQSDIEIGESVLIAAYVYIGPGNHRYSDPELPLIEQGVELKGGIKIGKNSWIGTRATILDGVTIGENAVVGAHSLVKDDVPDGAVVAGTPARIIRPREDSGSL